MDLLSKAGNWLMDHIGTVLSSSIDTLFSIPIIGEKIKFILAAAIAVYIVIQLLLFLLPKILIGMLKLGILILNLIFKKIKEIKLEQNLKLLKIQKYILGIFLILEITFDSIFIFPLLYKWAIYPLRIKKIKELNNKIKKIQKKLKKLNKQK